MNNAKHGLLEVSKTMGLVIFTRFVMARRQGY